MPRLTTSTTTSSQNSYLQDCISIFSIQTNQSIRWDLIRSVFLRSVRIQMTREGIPLVPLRIRPTFIVLNVFDLLFLGLLGFHPRGQTWVRINDKLLHLICFFFATALFYMIWDVDESARRSWIWRNAALLLSFITCFAVGSLGSEIVQSLLPYKTFQWGDVIANWIGSCLGLFFSFHLELRYRARREWQRFDSPLDIEEYDDNQQGTTTLESEIWDLSDIRSSHPAKISPQDLFQIQDDDDDED